MANEEVTKLDSHELEVQSTDPDNKPFIKIRGGLIWDTVAGGYVKGGGLGVQPHDYIALTYTGDNLTGVVFKNGGAGGTTVGTLTLAYTGARLDSVTKS